MSSFAFLSSPALPRFFSHPIRHSYTSPVCTAQTPTYAPCIPAEASLIRDSHAQAMLQRLLYTALPVALPQSPLFTSHVPPTTTSSRDPMLLLHGFDSNLLEYRYLQPLLPSSHAVDLLGWGLTEKPTLPNFPYDPLAKRAHLHAFTSHIFDDRKVVLVGASIGGCAAIDFALAYPDRVRALVLMDVPALLKKKKLGVEGLFAGVGAEVLRSEWLRSTAANLAYEGKMWRECKDVQRIGSLHCFTEGWKHAAVSFIKGDGYCVADRLRDIQCPTMVLWGEQDRVVPVGQASKLAKAIGTNDVYIIPNCGHSPHIEKSQEVAPLIENFLARHLP